jgi:hypothetical protein
MGRQTILVFIVLISTFKISAVIKVELWALTGSLQCWFGGRW